MSVLRKITHALDKAMAEFPIVTVTGPRQAGKTTLIREHFSHLPYVNLEEPTQRDFAQKDPNLFLKQFPNGGIIDEVQRVPELLSYLQIIVDERKKAGQFVLSGSHQFTLMQSVNQSLAGRTAVLNLFPFSISELTQARLIDEKASDTNELMVKGFYPRLYSTKATSGLFYSGYYQTYVERDVRELLVIKDLSLFKKFMILCAGRIGQVLNRESLARDVGISGKTVEEWLSVLEASFILFRLPPFYTNFGKRVIKSPKIFFYDVGLVCFLLEIETTQHLKTHPLRGNIFENMQVIEALKWRSNQGKPSQFYFYRDTNGNEIDLIFSQAGKIYPIEIKAAETFQNEFLKGIQAVSKETKLEHPLVVFGGTQRQERSEFTIVPWYGLEQELYKVTN
jgi:predicted AAA+ superfamily ATPase